MSDHNARKMPPLEPSSAGLPQETRESSPQRTGRQLSNPPQMNGVQAKGSNTSPSRFASLAVSQPNTTTPSAAAVQRASSASKSIAANPDGSADHVKDRLPKSNLNSPSWPTSPRLKSPPPASTRSVPFRSRAEGEQTPSNTSMKRLSQSGAVDTSLTKSMKEGDHEPYTSQSIARPAGRSTINSGGLETVAESSGPTTPSLKAHATPADESHSDPSKLEQFEETATGDTNNEGVAALETTSRPGHDKPDANPNSVLASRATSNSRPATSLAKRSFTNLASSKPKSATEPTRTMTVETEPVTSTSQLIGDRGRDGSGSVRVKASNETIRPKKKEKKPVRKTPSLHAGTGTSKADIFEAKVASAVDEADSSDSDETFVYESNPPEPRQARHHSRTPSATSLASQIDPYNGRGKHGSRSGSTVVTGKKSMKFSSSYHSNQLERDGASGDAGRGSTRAHGSTTKHHHIGRYGRNGHASIMDNDSPFTQANRVSSPRTPTANVARYSRPTSPRLSNGRMSGSPRKSVSGGYDTYDDGADDERAPLMGSIRVNRTRHSRRPVSGPWRPLEFAEQRRPGWWQRFGGCMLAGVLMGIIFMCLAAFVVALSRPLVEVEIVRIENVLASEQELMVDLLVKAINPNLFAIAVSDLDVNLFAVSPYVGTAREWQQQHHHQQEDSDGFRGMRGRRGLRFPGRTGSVLWPPFHGSDGVDEGTDPIDDPDPEPGTQKMLLGRIFEFDSPLVFDASPVQHNNFSSVGEIRLARPGNKTEFRGSARWERTIQHPFDLIVRGVIKYQLPLSSKTRSAKVNGRVKVPTNSDGGDGHENKTLSVADE